MKTLDGKEQENSYDGESAPIRRHIQGLGLSYVQTLGDNAYHSYHQDEQGSTAYITGQGRKTENIYQYDQETGQYYLRARYYNPVVGRFLQEDTYRGDGLNLYAYCAYDPSGHGLKSWLENLCKKIAEFFGEDTPAGEVVNKDSSDVLTGIKLPQGISSETFSDASKLIKENIGDISDNIVAQGSRASETAKERTMLHAIETGKIQAGEAGLRGLEKIFGIEADISIIEIDGPFDNPLFIPIE